MNAVPALAAAMAALLIVVTPDPDGEGQRRDERGLWLVAAAIALLVR